MAQKKLFCHKRFSKSYEFLKNFVIFVGLTYSNFHTMHTIIDNHEISSQKLLSFLLCVEWYIICGGLHEISKFDLLTAPSLGAFFSKWVPLFLNFSGWFRCSFSWRIILWCPFIYAKIFCSGEAIFCKFGRYLCPLFWHQDNLSY